jgi:hypothetical protein
MSQFLRRILEAGFIVYLLVSKAIPCPSNYNSTNGMGFLAASYTQPL